MPAKIRIIAIIVAGVVGVIRHAGELVDFRKFGGCQPFAPPG
jgi:hypothetical protein